MINPLDTWKSTFVVEIQPTGGEWAGVFSGWVTARVVNAEFAGVTTAGAPLIYNGEDFATALSSITPSTDKFAAADSFAAAWAAGLPPTLNVVAGDSYGVAWATVTSATLDSGSIDAAKLAIANTMSAAAPDDPESAVPLAFHTGFKALTGTITGTDSSPSPLVATAVPLI